MFFSSNFFYFSKSYYENKNCSFKDTIVKNVPLMLRIRKLNLGNPTKNLIVKLGNYLLLFESKILYFVSVLYNYIVECSEKICVTIIAK